MWETSTILGKCSDSSRHALRRGNDIDVIFLGGFPQAKYITVDITDRTLHRFPCQTRPGSPLPARQLCLHHRQRIALIRSPCRIHVQNPHPNPRSTKQRSCLGSRRHHSDPHRATQLGAPHRGAQPRSCGKLTEPAGDVHGRRARKSRWLHSKRFADLRAGRRPRRFAFTLHTQCHAVSTPSGYRPRSHADVARHWPLPAHRAQGFPTIRPAPRHLGSRRNTEESLFARPAPIPRTTGMSPVGTWRRPLPEHSLHSQLCKPDVLLRFRTRLFKCYGIRYSKSCPVAPPAACRLLRYARRTCRRYPRTDSRSPSSR